MMIRASFAVLLCSLAVAIPARPQVADTSVASHVLESIVVTADRSAGLLAQSTGAVSVITAGQLQRLPGVARLGDALRHVPGFAMLSIDGQGYDPQATVRGFYGGGEAAYVLVLLDGRPLNNMEMGLVNWSQIPLSAVKTVEVIRGGASSLYGDAAVGGVLNIVTERAKAGAERAQFAVSTGSFKTYQGEASVQTFVQGKPLSAFGSMLKTAGFREHSTRNVGSVGFSLGLLSGGRHEVTLSGLGHWRQYDIPGPLTKTALDQSRTQYSPFYQFDNVDENTLRLTVDGQRTLRRSAMLSGTVSGELRNADMVRTLPLAASFASTKERTVDTARLFASVKLVKEGLLSGTDKIVAGFDGSVGALDNAYYDMLTGTAGDYAAFSGARGGLSTQGKANRRVVAGFLQYDLMALTRLRMVLGGRYDAIRDSYEPEGGASSKASHAAFSPKMGVNFAFARSDRHVGHVYANYLGIFKAATLDQLYDQRLLPVPFPPYSISISNSELKPQRGTSYEVGLYHRLEMSRALASEWTFSVYRVNMKDELDFSFDTFSYANIAASKHEGIESGIRVFLGDRVTAHLNYTLQNVTYEEGDNKGKYVKGVPRDYVNLGFNVGLPKGIGVGAVLHSTARMYLDDANTMPLDDYATLDAVVSCQWRQVTFRMESTNLLDTEYSTTGFPDPDSASESGIVFLYPAAGRALRLGLTIVL